MRHNLIEEQKKPDEMTAAESVRELVTGCYMLVMFMAVPLLLKDRFRMLGTFKYEVFRLVSFVGLGIIFLTEMSVLWNACRKKQKTDFFSECSLTDGFVLGYGICVILSFCVAADRKEAFWGAQGWYMGLVSQMIFVASYFAVSRWWSAKKTVWYAACAAAFVVFGLGVLHRFSVDPFQMYEGLSENTIRQYLSLIGQNTWYSSYMCTLFPLGLFLFWDVGEEEQEGWRRRLAGGIFCAVGFASWVTQNSDSAYIALSLLFLALFCYGFRSNVWMERFLEVLLLCFFSASVIGFLQDIFADRAVLPDSLSLFFTKSLFPVIGFLAVCIVYIVFLYGEKNGFCIERHAWLGKAAVVGYGLTVSALMLVIVLNTKGYLAEWFGITTRNNYLLFDANWGNGRGRTWSYSAQVIRELPWYRKLFGVGPDCFAAYGYQNPIYAAKLAAMWGDSTLTNAHCEWMNQLICYGAAGAACFIGIFLSAGKRFWEAGKKAPVLIAIVGSLLAYAGHNIFCYQQAVCTPFLFLILGMGERLLRLEKQKSCL